MSLAINVQIYFRRTTTGTLRLTGIAFEARFYVRNSFAEYVLGKCEKKTDEITRAITIVERKHVSVSYTRFILFKLCSPKKKLLEHFRRTPTPFPFRVSFFFSFSADLYRSAVHGSHHVRLVLKRKRFYTSHSRSIDPRVFRPSPPAPCTTIP